MSLVLCRGGRLASDDADEVGMCSYCFVTVALLCVDGDWCMVYGVVIDDMDH
jgi:hypothetical protein